MTRKVKLKLKRTPKVIALPEREITPQESLNEILAMLRNEATQSSSATARVQALTKMANILLQLQVPKEEERMVRISFYTPEEEPASANA